MTKPGRKQQSLLANVILALASVALVLGVSEIAARLLWQDPATWKPAPRPAAWADLPELPGPMDLAHPNARGIHNGVLYEANSDGFRGREYARVKPPGVFRIVLLGDSFTMGAGVLQEDTYAARLEKTLNERQEQRRYEVLNLGVSGLASDIVVERMKKLGLRFDPDMIIYGFTLNDIEGPWYEKFEQKERARYVRAVQEPSRSPSYLLRLLEPRWESLRDLISPPPDSYIRELHYNYFENPRTWHRMLRDLHELGRIGEKLDVCTVLFIHTHLFYLHWFHPFLPYYDAVAEAALPRGFYVKQSFPAFKGHEASSLWVSPFDSHPNAEGHALLAQSLLEGLDALPEHCWRAEPSGPAGGGEGAGGAPR